MTNSTTLSIKTDPETKETIRQAAERIGLSINSFVLMVAKNAAEADEIIIRNTDAGDSRLLGQAIEFNKSHQSSLDWEDLKASYGV